MTMKNEALETHVVRHVRVLAARRPSGGRVLATLDGEFREATDVRALEACAAQEGDCLSKMQAFDGVERFSLTDGADLARKEILELQLPPGEGPRGLVMASRQSLASTYLFYQSLAYLGRSAGDTIAALERGDRTIGGALERLQQVLGGIEVAVETRAGTWITAGEVREMGPLATDILVVALPRSATGRVRLRLAQGHWRIDYLASVRLGPRVEPDVLEPTSVRDDDGGFDLQGLAHDTPRRHLHLHVPGAPQRCVSRALSRNPGLLPRMDARRVVVGREPVAGGATHAESGAAAQGLGP